MRALFALQAEATERNIRSIRYQTQAARFPVQRHLQGFDFSQSKVDQQLIRQLATMEFTAAAQNLVLVGGTGTGKTHLAIGIGTSGIQHHNKKVRFFSAIDLANNLEQEKSAGKQGRLALSLLQIDLVWVICHSRKPVAHYCFTCSQGFMNVPA